MQFVGPVPQNGDSDRQFFHIRELVAVREHEVWRVAGISNKLDPYLHQFHDNQGNELELCQDEKIYFCGPIVDDFLATQLLAIRVNVLLGVKVGL